MHNKFCTLALSGLLALGMAGTAAFAQDNSTPPPQDNGAPPAGARMGHRGMNSDAQLKHMTKQLNLSADQQSQIKPLLDSRQQQMQALWQDQSLSQADRRAKAKAIQDDTNSKIEAALNDTQKQQFEAQQAQMKAHRRARGQGADQQPSDTAPPASPQQQ